MNKIVIFTILLVLTVLASPAAFAHKLNVFAWVEGDMICVQSYFNRRSKPRNVPYKVFDEKGAVLAQGTTDEKGEFQYKPVSMTSLIFEVESVDGHKGTFKIDAEELKGIKFETAKEETNGENRTNLSKTGISAGATGISEEESPMANPQDPKNEPEFPEDSGRTLKTILGVLLILSVTALSTIVTKKLGRAKNNKSSERQ